MSGPEAWIVAGAAGGIGGPVVDELVRRGARVLAADLDIDALRARAAQWPSDRTVVVRLDVRDPEAWRAVVDEALGTFGELDRLLNVAGVLALGPVLDVTPQELRELLDVNVAGIVFGTQAAARAMLPRASGHVLNFVSLAGAFPMPGFPVYSASKYAARAFCLAADYELRPRGVAITAVCPGGVDTRMYTRASAWRESVGRFAATRPLAPDAVARAVLSPRHLRIRPRELYLPFRRAAVARVIDLFPGLAWELSARLGLTP